MKSFAFEVDRALSIYIHDLSATSSYANRTAKKVSIVASIPTKAHSSDSDRLRDLMC